MNSTTFALAPLSLRASLAAATAALLVLALGAGGGCAQHGRGAQIRLASTGSKAVYRQQFADAYVSKVAQGNTEIVLVNDAGADESAGAVPASHAAGEAIQPGGVRQIMHLKILWKPQRGTKQSHPSYTNAGIHWYVFDEAPAGQRPSQVLEYTGAGFIALSDTALGTQVIIRNALIKPVGPASGSLSDPIGPAKLTGTFFATKSKKRVNELLSEVEVATSGARAEQASAR